jgi:diamine N-acetyltransferase
MILVRKAGADALPTIKNLANIIWPVTYSEIITQQQVDYMMELMYSTAALQKQLQNGHRFIIAYEADKPVAFAAYASKDNQPFIYHLHKIYILPTEQGKGIGKSLMNYIKDDIAPANTLQLNVNRKNKALQFYQKMGFTIISEEDIDIGNGFYMNDYVMEMTW